MVTSEWGWPSPPTKQWGSRRRGPGNAWSGGQWCPRGPEQGRSGCQALPPALLCWPADPSPCWGGGGEEGGRARRSTVQDSGVQRRQRTRTVPGRLPQTLVQFPGVPRPRDAGERAGAVEAALEEINPCRGQATVHRWGTKGSEPKRRATRQQTPHPGGAVKGSCMARNTTRPCMLRPGQAS